MLIRLTGVSPFHQTGTGLHFTDILNLIFTNQCLLSRPHSYTPRATLGYRWGNTFTLSLISLSPHFWRSLLDTFWCLAPTSYTPLKGGQKHWWISRTKPLPTVTSTVISNYTKSCILSTGKMYGNKLRKVLIFLLKEEYPP